MIPFSAQYWGFSNVEIDAYLLKGKNDAMAQSDDKGANDSNFKTVLYDDETLGKFDFDYSKYYEEKAMDWSSLIGGLFGSKKSGSSNEQMSSFASAPYTGTVTVGGMNLGISTKQILIISGVAILGIILIKKV